MRYTLLICLAIVFCLSCTEKETIYVNQHENVTIDGNTPPPYAEITSVQIQNYINKLYIDLLAREPSFVELDNATTFLKNNMLSETSRNQLVDDLMAGVEYYTRFWEVYRRAYLNGVTDQEMLFQLSQIEDIYAIFSQDPDPYSQAVAAFYFLEIEKMELLIAAKDDYKNGTIAIDEFMLRVCHNNIYDEINMGAENMVLSCFENLLKRLPTQAELAAGTVMINDGQSAQLLLQDGNDKVDFVNIITSTPEFFQGLAFDIYQQLLVREPTSVEMTKATDLLMANKDFQAIQKQVAISDEYAGF